MMDRLDKETEAVAAASDAPLVTSGSKAIYPLPVEYRKQIRYIVDGQAKAFKGRRALMLDLLNEAKPAGIGRADTWRWIGNPGDPIEALRKKGLQIDTHKGQPQCYVLRSSAKRIGGAA